MYVCERAAAERRLEPYGIWRLTSAPLGRTVARMASPAPLLLAERPLKESDILGLGTRAAVKPEPLTKVSQRHHALARCLAAGMSSVDAALATGYSTTRVFILQTDELFQELVAFYTDAQTDVFKANAEQLQGLTSEALALLRDRIESGEVTTKELIEAAKLAADRSGHGPQSSVNVEVDISLSERLARARKRVEENTIEGELVA